MFLEHNKSENSNVVAGPRMDYDCVYDSACAFSGLNCPCRSEFLSYAGFGSCRI